MCNLYTCDGDHKQEISEKETIIHRNQVRCP